MNVIERFRKYRKGGLLLRKFQPGGVTYRRENSQWKGSDGSTLNSAYVKTSKGWKHLDTTGTVSEVNEFGYVGVPYDYRTGKGLKELRQHIDSELNRQGFTDSYINSNYISANNLSQNAARNRDNIRNYAIKLGFNSDQTKALLMNAFNENGFNSGSGLNNAQGFFQFDGSLQKKYNTFASKYKNRPRYQLELEFIKNYLDEVDKLPSYVGMSPDSQDNSKLKEFGIVSGYSNIPENSEVYNKWTINPDSSSRLVYGIQLRNQYASRANYERDNNESRNNGGNSYRYTLLPVQHYARAFSYSKEGDFTPRQLAWMFNVIFEKSGKPNASRFYDQF